MNEVHMDLEQHEVKLLMTEFLIFVWTVLLSYYYELFKNPFEDTVPVTSCCT